MKDCNECELALYCYSDPETWTFRTKEQMREIVAQMQECATYQKLKDRLNAEERTNGEETKAMSTPDHPPRSLSRR